MRIILKHAFNGRHDRGNISGPSDNNTGLTIDNRFSRTSTQTGNDGHTAGRRFQKHDAEPLLLQSSPSIAAQHRENISRTKQWNKVGVINATKETNGCSPMFRTSFKAGAIASRSSDRHLQCWPPLRQLGTCVDQNIETFSGNESTHAQDERSIWIETQVTSDIGSIALRNRNKTT